MLTNNDGVTDAKITASAKNQRQTACVRTARAHRPARGVRWQNGGMKHKE